MMNTTKWWETQDLQGRTISLLNADSLLAVEALKEQAQKAKALPIYDAHDHLGGLVRVADERSQERVERMAQYIQKLRDDEREAETLLLAEMTKRGLAWQQSEVGLSLSLNLGQILKTILGTQTWIPMDWQVKLDSGEVVTCGDSGSANAVQALEIKLGQWRKRTEIAESEERVKRNQLLGTQQLLEEANKGWADSPEYRQYLTWTHTVPALMGEVHKLKEELNERERQLLTSQDEAGVLRHDNQMLQNDLKRANEQTAAWQNELYQMRGSK